MKYIIRNIIPVAVLALVLGITACSKNEDDEPITPNTSTGVNLDALFNACYAYLAISGNVDANGNYSIAGYEERAEGFISMLFNSNELPTDEVICSWGESGFTAFNFNQYDANHQMMHKYYTRLTTGISCCNGYLNEVGDDGDPQKKAEVRFLRALYYYMLMDAFGNIPFTLELTTPIQISRQEAFNWIEHELLLAEPDLMDAKAMKSIDMYYGRATKGACWMLLARMYLNAEVYTGEARWAKAVEYANKVISANYQLNTAGANQWSAYQMLFMADNGESSAAYESVFSIPQDGSNTNNGMLYLIASIFDDKVHANPLDPNATNNTNQAWGGNRARPQLVLKFFPNGDVPEGQSYVLATTAGDDRALFCSEDRTLDVWNVGDFTNGFAVAKWINFRSDNGETKSASFPDTDFFLFRLAEAYLTAAEADARMNGGVTSATGTELINRLRMRANATTKNVYDLGNIIDEWAREFYYEGRRRVDLIRFGLYGGNNVYPWQWKSGAFPGRNFSADLNIYAIPHDEIAMNSNLKQNPGYR